MAVKQQNKEFKDLYNELKNMKLATTYISDFNYEFSINEATFLNMIESDDFKSRLPKIYNYITSCNPQEVTNFHRFKTEFKNNWKYYQKLNMVYEDIQKDYKLRYETNKIEFAGMEFHLDYFLENFAKNDLKFLIVTNIYKENRKLFLLITSSNKKFSELNLVATNQNFREIVLKSGTMKRKLLKQITYFIKYYQLITSSPCIGKQIEFKV